MLGILASIFYIRTLGGVGAFFESREDVADSLQAAGFQSGSQVGQSFLTAFGQVPVIVAFIAWTVYLTVNHIGSKALLDRTIWALLLAVNLIVNNPIANSRFWFLTVIIGFVFSLREFGPRAYRISITLGLFAALIVFPYADYFRRSASQRGGLHVAPVATTLSTKDYDQSVMTANGIWYADHFGHTWGHQLLGVVFFWVPRGIWPDKALDTGVLVGKYVATAGTTNLSSPLWEEIWIDFGVVGVVAAFFLIGRIARVGDELFRHAKQVSNSPNMVLVFLPLIAGYQFILMRGPLLQAAGRLSVILLATYFIHTKKVADLEHRRNVSKAKRRSFPGIK